MPTPVTLGPKSSASLTPSGSVVLLAGMDLGVELGGLFPGLGGYDQLDVTGTVTLAGAALTASLVSGFNPLLGAAFTIIQNDGTDSVTGTFAGLAEGAEIVISGRNFTISYVGGDGNDIVLTRAAAFLIRGSTTGDTLDGTTTVDKQDLATDGENLIRGRGGNDHVSGLGGNDEVRGGKGKDTVDGGTGDDMVFGRYGRNTLTGGDGADMFVFDTRLGKGSDAEKGATYFTFSTITDFTPGVDLIHLDQSIFKTLAVGALSADTFALGTEATTALQRILYDMATGEIRYDKDGVGGLDPIHFATLTPGTALAIADILVI